MEYTFLYIYLKNERKMHLHALQQLDSRITSILSVRSTADTDRALKKKAANKESVFTRDWSKQLQKTIQFECTPEEWAYVTMPRDAMYIHRVIAESLGEEQCTVFIDAFACVGGDTIAAMDRFRTARIFAVQK